jgi:hypothetical protein
MTLLTAFHTECLSKKLRPDRDFAKASKHVAPGHLTFVFDFNSPDNNGLAKLVRSSLSSLKLSVQALMQESTKSEPLVRGKGVANVAALSQSMPSFRNACLKIP